MTLVKICGITNIEDAVAAVQSGADFLGFIFADSPRYVDVRTVSKIKHALAGNAGNYRSEKDHRSKEKADSSSCLLGMTERQVLSYHCPNRRLRTVGVFTEASDEVLRIMDECGLDYAQLHGGQSEDFARRIGADRVIRVARMKDESSVDSLAGYTQAAFYLLDTYKRGQAGGTGEIFDWELAVRAKSLGRPLFLSGGLKPENIMDAINAVKPYAVDISSGVETGPGRKDHNKIKELIENVRTADNAS